MVHTDLSHTARMNTDPSLHGSIYVSMKMTLSVHFLTTLRLWVSIFYLNPVFLLSSIHTNVSGVYKVFQHPRQKQQKISKYLKLLPRLTRTCLFHSQAKYSVLTMAQLSEITIFNLPCSTCRLHLRTIDKTWKLGKNKTAKALTNMLTCWKLNWMHTKCLNKNTCTCPTSPVH